MRERDIKEKVKKSKGLLLKGYAAIGGGFITGCILWAWGAGWYWYFVPLILLMCGYGLHAVMRDELLGALASEKGRGDFLVEELSRHIRIPIFENKPPEADPCPDPSPPQKNWIM